MLKMKHAILFIFLTLFVACSSKKTATATSIKEMQVKDVTIVLKASISNFSKQTIQSGSGNQYLLTLTPDEYNTFVDKFITSLGELGKTSFGYQASGVRSTTFDDKLSSFSISLGKKNTYDIIVSGSYDTINNRLLLRIYDTKP